MESLEFYDLMDPSFSLMEGDLISTYYSMIESWINSGYGWTGEVSSWKETVLVLCKTWKGLLGESDPSETLNMDVFILNSLLLRLGEFKFNIGDLSSGSSKMGSSFGFILGEGEA